MRHIRAALAGAAVIGALSACTAQQAATTTTTAGTTAAAETSAAATSAGSSEDLSSGSITVSSAESAGSSEDTASSADSTAAPADSSTAAADDGTYADGSYTATGTYQSPAGQESVEVEVTLTDDVVTEVTVTPQASNPNSVQYQTMFAENVSSEVVGKSIDELAVSKVAGSSLTSGGFNAAIEQIKTEATQA
ncbi:FMN-binding protein [Nakamurella alba]|nr:hypothetical protein [Nakamurella alba]